MAGELHGGCVVRRERKWKEEERMCVKAALTEGGGRRISEMLGFRFLRASAAAKRRGGPLATAPRPQARTGQTQTTDATDANALRQSVNCPQLRQGQAVPRH